MNANKFRLDDLAEETLDDQVFPLRVEMAVHQLPSEQTVKNIKKLNQLGILNADTIMALIGQAPIDSIGLMSALMRQFPGKWAFSAVDFSMFRVLTKTDKGEVAAALRVDLLQGDTVQGIARNQSNQLTLFREVTVTPGNTENEKMLEELVRDTSLAARREGHS